MEVNKKIVDEIKPLKLFEGAEPLHEKENRANTAHFSFPVTAISMGENIVGEEGEDCE